MPVLLYDHDHLALAWTIKLAKKNPLPTSEQQFSILEENGYRRTDQGGFHVRIGIFFAMAKAHSVLRNQGAESVQHVARDVRIGIFVYRQTRCGVLHVQHNYTFLFAGVRQLLLDVIRELDKLFARVRADF